MEIGNVYGKVREQPAVESTVTKYFTVINCNFDVLY